MADQAKQISLENKTEQNDQRGNQESAMAGAQPARDGGGRNTSRSNTPLEGAPIVQGATGPDANLVSIAGTYAKKNGIDLRRLAAYADIDWDFFKRITNTYEVMAHYWQKPSLKDAYCNLVKQIRAEEHFETFEYRLDIGLAWIGSGCTTKRSFTNGNNAKTQCDW